jgi:hypothetical protein
LSGAPGVYQDHCFMHCGEGYTRWVLRPLPKVITILGILCVTIGIAWGFVEESTSFGSRFFTEYAGVFLITLLVGVLLSMGGTLAWTRHFSKAKKFKIAGWVFFAGLLAMIIAPKNVHGPGMLLMLTAVSAWILSIILTLTTAGGGDRQVTPG